MLLESTGFQGDQAVIDGVMLVIDAYAVSLASQLPGPPDMVREGYVHLLMQQAELLLDSGGRLAQAAALAEKVTDLTRRFDLLTSAWGEEVVMKVDEVVRTVMREYERRPAEHTEEQMQAYADSYELPEVHGSAPAGLIPGDFKPEEHFLSEVDANALADWERELLAGTAGKTQVCVECGQSKPLTAEYWWRNSNSETGYEKRCSACRGREKNARRKREREARRAA